MLLLIVLWLRWLWRQRRLRVPSSGVRVHRGRCGGKRRVGCVRLLILLIRVCRSGWRRGRRRMGGCRRLLIGRRLRRRRSHMKGCRGRGRLGRRRRLGRLLQTHLLHLCLRLDDGLRLRVCLRLRLVCLHLCLLHRRRLLLLLPQQSLCLRHSLRRGGALRGGALRGGALRRLLRGARLRLLRVPGQRPREVRLLHPARHSEVCALLRKPLHRLHQPRVKREPLLEPAGEVPERGDGGAHRAVVRIRL